MILNFRISINITINVFKIIKSKNLCLKFIRSLNSLKPFTCLTIFRLHRHSKNILAYKRETLAYHILSNSICIIISHLILIKIRSWQKVPLTSTWQFKYALFSKTRSSFKAYVYHIITIDFLSSLSHA